MGRTPTALAIDAQQAEDVRALGKLAVDGDQIASLIGVSRRKVYDLTVDKNDPIPHLKIGERIVFPVQRVAAWLEARAKGGRPAAPPPVRPALLNTQDTCAVLGGIMPDHLAALGLPTLTIGGQTLYPVDRLLQRVGELVKEGA